VSDNQEQKISLSVPIGLIATAVAVGLVAAAYALKPQTRKSTSWRAGAAKKRGKGIGRRLGLSALIALLENDASRMFITALIGRPRRLRTFIVLIENDVTRRVLLSALRSMSRRV